MNETPAPASPSDFPGFPTAWRLGIALLTAVLLVLVMAWRDGGRRGQLETVDFPSSVGDTRYLPLSDPLPVKPYPAVAKLNGQPLFPVDYKRRDKREADLVKAGEDPAAGLAIYRSTSKDKDEEKDSTPVYFIKLAPGEFLKVRATQEGK